MIRIHTKGRMLAKLPAMRRDVVMLADSVNQIAMITEELLASTYRTVDLQERLRRERARVAEIIDRYDP